MSDDIIKEQAELMRRFTTTFPHCITIEDTMRHLLVLNDEIERLQTIITHSDKLWDAFEQDAHEL